MSWVPAGHGYLALGHRPRRDAFGDFRDSDATMLVTLLSESEGAEEIGTHAAAAGLGWVWLPLALAKPPPPERDAEIRAAFEKVRAALDGGGRVFVHCSAGIQRTGMIAYALLRFLGDDAKAARDKLARARRVTAEGVGEARLAWGDRFA